jgi:eukaryotic-like serine/threonine-protein kinase
MARSGRGETDPSTPASLCRSLLPTPRLQPARARDPFRHGFTHWNGQVSSSMNTPDPSDETIFAGALAQPAAARATFLDRACAGDPARRARIESLLQAHEAAEAHFMATAATPAAIVEPATGERIGRYKLLQKIGEGGCGIVYMAEQTEPVVRRVALKVIKLGMDTKEVIARFEAERQALALMDHPNIARVFDGGATETGRPFFVMELVRGVRITRYCDEQNLPTTARLELFTQVCHAVQHAHQKGIIHRDLKPSNILVTLHDGKPVPKVIDFGIAKATQGRLTDATLFTAFEQFIGTPAYMSPEQAEMSGLDIDTRSDIYSLGVLLYELLTGRPPFDPKTLIACGLDEIRRIIREVEPPRMSTRLSTLNDLDRATIAKSRGILPAQLSTLLRGDLDWIVMRCLEKDRTRRYETANGLALDVLRHLHDEPVIARPPAPAYRVAKFIRRNQRMVIAVAMVIVTLVAGIIISSWQAVRATRADKMAQADRAAAIAERTLAMQARQLAEASRNNEATQRKQAESSARAAEIEAATSAAVTKFLEEDLLSQASPDHQPDRELKLRTVLDRAATKVDRAFPDRPLVEASIRTTLATTYHSLGEYAASGKQLERAMELRRRELGETDPSTLSTVCALLNAYRMTEMYAPGEALAIGTLANIRRNLGEDHAEAANVMSSLAPIYVGQGKLVEASHLHAQSLAIRTRVFGPEHPQTANAMSNLASVLQREGKLAEAVDLFAKTLDLRRRTLGKEHRDTLETMRHLAAALNVRGLFAESAQLHAETLEIRKRTLGTEHPDTLRSQSDLAFAYRSIGKLEEAAAMQNEVVEVRKRVLGVGHSQTLTSMRYLAEAEEARGDSAKAIALYQETAELAASALGTDHSETLQAMSKLASVYRVHDKPAEAAVIYERVLEIMKRVFGPEHPKTLETMTGLASCYRSLRRFKEAAAGQAAVATTRARVLGPEHPQTLAALSFVGMNWRSEGKLPEAVDRLAEVYVAQKRVQGLQRQETLFTAEELGGALLQMESFDRAEAVLRESLAARKSFERESRQSIMNQWALAEALIGLRRFDDANAMIAEGLDALRRNPVPAIAESRLRSAANRVLKLAAKVAPPELAATWQRKFVERGFPAAGGK